MCRYKLLSFFHGKFIRIAILFVRLAVCMCEGWSVPKIVRHLCVDGSSFRMRLIILGEKKRNVSISLLWIALPFWTKPPHKSSPIQSILFLFLSSFRFHSHVYVRFSALTTYTTQWHFEFHRIVGFTFSIQILANEICDRNQKYNRYSGGGVMRIYDLLKS